jgi:hypothetical protein
MTHKALSSNENDLFKELAYYVEKHNKIAEATDAKIAYIYSNHDDFLARWLDTGAGPTQIKNLPLYSILQTVRTTVGNKRFFETAVKRLKVLLEAVYEACGQPNPPVFPEMSALERTSYIYPDSKFGYMDIDLSQHGNHGMNGARGSGKSFSSTGLKLIVGHSHTPEWVKDVIVVGTSSKLILDYNQKGYSSWFHSHAIIYKNGKRTLLNIVDGQWRLPSND